MLALTGFLIILIMMLLIFKSKALPAFCFVALPVIGALACGFSIAEIGEFIEKGLGTTWKTAILFIFSITYFGIMNDVGLFDKLVDGLVSKAGKNVTLVLVFTTIIAVIGHIDGAAATTYLITIPTMLPIYKKMKIKPVILLLLCGASTGIMNLVPWGDRRSGRQPPPEWMQLNFGSRWFLCRSLVWLQLWELHFFWAGKRQNVSQALVWQERLSMRRLSKRKLLPGRWILP